MLVVARDRVQKLKTAGKSADEIAASKPVADLDPVWGHGMLSSEILVRMIYSDFNSHPAGGLDHCSRVSVEEVFGREVDMVSAKADVDDLLKVGRSCGWVPQNACIALPE
jgi:hypothetical protein